MENRSSKPVAQIVAGIQALDLDPIKVKLMDAEEGQGWTREYADAMEVAYKRFLMLLVKYPETTVAPSKEIDKFWHAHILDTLKYAEDCEQVFGYFLHHFPYFGMRGAEDAARLDQASRDMQRLYAEEFDATVPSVAAHCYAAKPGVASAHCYAAVSDTASAHCYAAQPEVRSAHCYAAAPEVRSAHCYAAAPEVGSAHCYAATPEANSAHCYAAMAETASAHCYTAVTNAMRGAAANADAIGRPSLAVAA